MEKYYTPEIEEFHVGLIIQIKNDKGWTGDIEWDENCSFPQHTDCEFRVKHLDREDIESLGYTDLGSLWFENKETDSRIRKWKGTQVDIYTNWLKNGKSTDDSLRFRGSIKNKSELKKILKMIGV